MKTLRILALALVACGGTTIDQSGDAGGDASNVKSDASTHAPKNHRATAIACPSGRGSEDPQYVDSGVPGDCFQDSDCTNGKNGRCTPSMGGAFTLQCSYDQCGSDGDCGGTVCVCREDSSSTAPNVCGSTKSNCRVDADCGSGGYCSPSESSDTFCFSASLTYFCHTSSDECIDDTDCTNGSCNYDTSSKHWKCGSICAPPPP
jgi:hypothetical protein